MLREQGEDVDCQSSISTITLASGTAAFASPDRVRDPSARPMTRRGRPRHLISNEVAILFDL
jgi:hypothetical protein